MTTPATTTTAPSSLTIDSSIWKTIKLGTGLRTPEDFVHAVKKVRSTPDAYYGICEVALRLLSTPAFTVSEIETEVDLVIVSIGQLGFDDNFTCYADIFARAQSLGLELCPAEVGPQLRIQYMDQPEEEHLSLAMEPIASPVGGAHLGFVVEKKNWYGIKVHADLTIYSGGLHRRCHRDERLIFVKPRK